MKSQTPKSETYQDVVLNNLQLNNYHKTDLAILLSNAPLLAMLQQANQQIHSRDANFLLSSIESASITLGNMLSAVSLALMDKSAPASEYITPYIFTSFAATVGEVLPILQSLSNDIHASIKPNP